MNPLDQIKQYANLIISIIILLMCAYGMWYLYHKGVENGIAEEHVKTVAVQTDFDTYKLNMDQQTIKAKMEADRIQHEQENKYAKAKIDYNTNITTLAERLRDLPPMLCGKTEPSLLVAKDRTNTVSTEAASARRVVEALKTSAGARPVFKYEDAVMDTYQCSRLIDFVKKM
jgi:hypothetical protein